MWTGKLRPYQAVDSKRLLEWKRGLIAYDQGVGKTAMAIWVAEQASAREGGDFTTIVFANGGLGLQWAQAIAQFTDAPTRKKRAGKGSIIVPTEEHTIIVEGGPQRRHASYVQAGKTMPKYVIMSYGNVVTDFEPVEWLAKRSGMYIADEATNIKNAAAARTLAMKELPPARYRYGLTADPIENGKLEEIFSVMEFIDPSVFGRADIFDATFLVRHPHGYVLRYKEVPLFLDLLSTVMVRKRAEDRDVAPYMPKKCSKCPHLHLLELGIESAKIYRKIADELIEELYKLRFSSVNLAAIYSGQGQDAKTQGRIAARLLALFMLVDYPPALLESANAYNSWKAKKPRPQTPVGSSYAASLLRAGYLDGIENFPTKKRDYVEFFIDQILGENDESKVIVFDRFKPILRDLNESIEWNTVLYTGDMSPAQKAEAQQKFNTDQDIRVILSSDAGGYGVDLPGANHLVNIGVPFEAGKSRQRNTRHRRTSSEWETIHDHDVIIAGGVDEFYRSKLKGKIAVATAYLDGQGHDKRGQLHIDAGSLRSWLEEHRDLD